MERPSSPKPWLCISYLSNSPCSWSFTAQLHYQMSHLQKPKSQNKSWGVAAMHGFERLQKVTGARQTAQDSSPGSQASSSPGAQRGSQLISCLLCRKRGCRKCPVLHPHLCFSLIPTAATQSWVKQSSLSSRDKLSWAERCFLGCWTASAPSGHPCACPAGRAWHSLGGTRDGAWSLTGVEHRPFFIPGLEGREEHWNKLRADLGLISRAEDGKASISFINWSSLGDQPLSMMLLLLS